MKIDKWLERRTLGRAAAMTALTPEFKDVLLEEYPRLAERSAVISHGFDEDSLNAVEAKKEEGFSLVYGGRSHTRSMTRARFFMR